MTNLIQVLPITSYLKKLQNTINILAVLFYIFFLNTLSFAQPTPPSQVEIDVFNAKLERLKTNVGLHPHAVTEILNSLEGSIVKMVECPPSSGIDKVVINIKTTQIKWTRNLIIDEEQIPINPESIGWYQWDFSQKLEDGMKIIDACNYIMLDSAVMVQQEASPPYGPIADEGLLYHELLHGQLVIDSIMNNSNYQAKLCNCVFDLNASDVSDHVHVHELEERYIEELLKKQGAEDPKAHVIIPEAQSADEDGKFEIVVGDEELLDSKEGLTISTYFPKGANVDESSIGLEVKDGKIYITGMLINKEEAGLFGVIIDPPEVFLFVGLEDLIRVLPYTAPIPTLTIWGGIITLLLLMIIGAFFIKSNSKYRSQAGINNNL
jgi:hypothetical protein